MNLSGINFGMQPFATPYTNLQMQIPQQTSIPCQPINQPINVTAGLSMPMSFGSIPDIGRYYIPYPQVYLQNAPTFEQPQQTQTLPQTQAQVQRLQPNMQFFGNGQVQSQSQTQQAAQNQLKTELEQNVNLQTRNNQIFGQNQGQTQEISPKSLNAINNYPNSNFPMPNMQANQIQT